MAPIPRADAHAHAQRVCTSAFVEPGSFTPLMVRAAVRAALRAQYELDAVLGEEER